MAQSDEAKRRAVSAVTAVRDDIHRVVTFGSTGYDAFGQPHLNPEADATEIPWATRWRDAQDQKALIEELRDKQPDVSAPGE